MNTEDEMTENGNTHSKPPGIFVTLREIHSAVLAIDDKLDTEIGKLREEISKIKTQLAAQWVIVGIVITTIAFLVQKGLS